MHPKKRVRLLSEIINLKIGDIADKILDEIIHDLTPYGYKPLSHDISNQVIMAINAMDELAYIDNRKTYIRIKDKSYGVLYDNLFTENTEEVYANDIIADIVLNADDVEVVTCLTDEITKIIPANYIRNLYNETPITRRMMLLRRKTISRNHRKIARIILENVIDMKLTKDRIPDMSIRVDEVKEFIKNNKK